MTLSVSMSCFIIIIIIVISSLVFLFLTVVPVFTGHLPVPSSNLLQVHRTNLIFGSRSLRVQLAPQ